MDELVRFLLVFSCLSSILSGVRAATYSVLIGTDSHINIVSNKFLSLTVDPKYLFAANEDHSRQDLKFCMASALVPSYLRVAGPSTSTLNLSNYTITFTDSNAHVEEELPPNHEIGPQFTRGQRQASTSLFLDSQELSNKKSIETFGLKKKRFEIDTSSYGRPKKYTTPLHHPRTFAQRLKQAQTKNLEITYFQWKNFTNWAQNAGFDLVFALNNEKRMANGLWDPNTALNILTFANNDNVTKVYWQLGYECKNQSIDSYLNDLETLGAIVESYAPRKWKTIGGDISKCLSASSKNDFRDYVILTDQMTDAVVLDANSSAYELNRMAEDERNQLLDLLGHSYTPLWLVDSHPVPPFFEFHRAVDWVTSLGYSAKNGFAVHFRELIEEEIYQPSLSFYMALLFKHLVGNKVLNVDMESSEAILFAHCTSLHRMPIPGAMTVYGANLGDETARFLMKLQKREDGGDIMQFILGNDLNGDVILNGQPITEVNIRPVVKHVRPYKTLLLSLPPKSIGFWVVANSKFNGCQVTDDDFVETVKEHYEKPVQETVKEHTEKPVAIFKRSVYDLPDLEPVSVEALVRKGIEERINIINSNLQKIRKAFGTSEEVVSRKKRQVDDDELSIRKSKLREILEKYRRGVNEPRLDSLKRRLELLPRSESIRVTRHEKGRQSTKLNKSKNLKKVPKTLKLDVENGEAASDIGNRLNRTRRSLVNPEKSNVEPKSSEESSLENEIEPDTENEIQLRKILHKIQEQIEELSVDIEDKSVMKQNHDSFSEKLKPKREENLESGEELFLVKTKMDDDGATIGVTQKRKRGLFWAFNNAFAVLDNLNDNINRIWNDERDSNV